MSGILQTIGRKLRSWREGRGILRMVDEEFKGIPDRWQEEALLACADPDPEKRRVSLQACAGPGKSTVLAWFIWWFMGTQGAVGEHPKGVATSITGDNLKDNLWAEVSKWQQRSDYYRGAFTWTSSAIFANDHPETWKFSARSWPKTANADEQGKTLSGLHSKYVAAVIDESGAIPLTVAKAAEQALSNCTFGKLLQAGNPISLDGMLYAAAGPQRHLWVVIRVTGDPDDPNRSPRIDLRWAREQIELHGRENPWVKSYILGQFPPASINALLGIEEVERAMAKHYRPSDYEDGQKRIGVDVARFGDDRCHDDQTEILTDAGWKLFADLTGDERVLSLDGDTAVWGPILHIHQAPWDGPLNVLECRHVNFAITDNHRLLVRSNPKSDRYVFRSYRDLPDEFVMRAGNTWSGTSHVLRQFTTTKPMPHGGEHRRNYTFAMTDWAEFLGWFVAEGNVYQERRASGRVRVILTQYPGAKREHLEALLSRMDLTWRATSNGFQLEFSNQTIGRWLIEHCGVGATNKRVPREVREGSPAVIRRFLDGFLAGDGTVRADGYGRTYITSSRLLADDLQEMLAKIGRAGLIRRKNVAGSTFVIGGRSVTRDHDTYVVYERSFESGKYVTKRDVQQVHYRGTVWCVATPLESIYVRRHGVSMWGGNTVIFPRQGIASFIPEVMRAARTTAIAARVAKGFNTWKAELILIDDTGHWGHGAVDALITSGYPCIPIIASDPAIDRRYKNRRAEMWLEMAKAIKAGCALPPLPELVRELTAPTYTFVAGKFVLEEKDQIKQRIGASPDLADALAQTFAIPDQPGKLMRELRGSATTKHDFDPYATEQGQEQGPDRSLSDFNPYEPTR